MAQWYKEIENSPKINIRHFKLVRYEMQVTCLPVHLSRGMAEEGRGESVLPGGLPTFFWAAR